MRTICHSLALTYMATGLPTLALSTDLSPIMAAPPPVQLPSLDEIHKSASDDERSALKTVVSTLFEHSPVLDEHLVPNLASSSSFFPFTSYEDLIDRSAVIIRSMPQDLRSEFISGHPRIGEQNPKQLSALSAAEQARYATPQWVIERLGWLNGVYERRYGGLRYITFVNGRTRTEVMEEMEGMVDAGKARGPEWKEEGESSAEAEMEVSGEEWSKELERAVGEVILIARDRVRKLGLA
jgi:2-oxo-4-hydroxy-4-carboxy--5-ureidoimidazoline (OHCU) decarboxylase